MTELDPVVCEALAVLSPEREWQPDWEDALARAAENGYRQSTQIARPPRPQKGAAARRLRRRRLLVVAALVVLAVLFAVPAFGLRDQLVHLFGSGKPAPVRIVKDFQQFDVFAPAGRGTGVIWRRARLVEQVPLDNGRIASLYAAPASRGGFCTMVEIHRPGRSGGRYGGCTRLDVQRRPLTVGVSIGRTAANGVISGGPVIVDGVVSDRNGASLQIVYQDGQRSRIPLVWISQPIGAALFVTAIPRLHWQPGHLPTAVILLDSNGKPIARDTTFRNSLNPQTNRTCKLGPNVVPCDAILGKRHRILALATQRGKPAAIWTAPARHGGRCWWQVTGTHGGGSGFGCNQPPPPNSLLVSNSPSMGKGIDQFVLLWGQVGANIASLTLHYQDGATETTAAKHGFVLYEITANHWRPGHRLDLIEGLDNQGQVVAQRPMNTTTPGSYPCDKPTKIGQLIDGEPIFACP
jgi:hypothetical protein